MKKCFYCKKVIWPWQKRMGYTYVSWLSQVIKPPTTCAHMLCDRKVFKDSLYELNKTNPGMFNEYWIRDQMRKRKKLYH